MMKKILIVTDSTICMDINEAKEMGIIIAPLSVILEGKEYQDQVELSSADLVNKLKEKAAPKTSQPNLGLLDEMMKKFKEEDYDHIIVFALSSNLSGTYQAFRLAAAQNDLRNIDIVDTLTLAGPQRAVVLKAAEMAKGGASKEDILNMAQKAFKNTVSYLYPETLEQLKRGGRVSPAAAALSSLLKIKALLILENGATTIEKMGTARTETKIFEMLLESLEQHQVSAKTHKLYLLSCEAMDTIDRFKEAATKKFGDIHYEVYELPAVLAAHAGLGTIAVQAALLD